MAAARDTRWAQDRGRGGVGRRTVVALGGIAAGAGLAAAVARPAAAGPAAGPAEGPQTGADDGTRPTAHRDAYFRRARF